MKDKDVFDMYSELIELNNRNTTNTNYDEDAEVFVAEEKPKSKQGSDVGGIRDPDDDEYLHFKRYTTPHRHKYTEKEMDQIRESCIGSIVHDYSERDFYHLSNDDRVKNDSLSEISLKLRNLKRIYKRVDQFIEAMRVVYRAWSIYAEGDFVHRKKDFFKMIRNNRITSSRIIMPKLKKMETYNMDLIINYISNPDLDPSHLVPAPLTRIFSDKPESDEQKRQRLLTSEEREHLENVDKIIPVEVEDVERKYIKGYDRRNYRSKKDNKHERRFRESLALMLNKIQSSPHYRNRESYTIINGLFQPEKREKEIWEKIPFTGSWGNKDDVRMYELAIQDELRGRLIPGERYLTYGDKELEWFFRELENNGVNVTKMRRIMNVTAGNYSKQAAVVTKKDNRKIESRIVQRLLKLNNSKRFKKTVANAEKDLAKERGVI